MIGQTHGAWLTVDYLWAREELRGSGSGSSLLRAAEEKAVKRSCRYCFLNTFSFQAPDFYKKHGYREVFTPEHYPVDGKRHYYVKELRQPDPQP